MKNIEDKDELRKAAALAAGPTPQESAFWNEVAGYLDEGTTVTKAKALDIEPRLTGSREKGTV